MVTDASGKYTSSLKSNTVTANHAFGEWEVTKEATCTEDGSQTRTCEKCNYQETQAISAKDTPIRLIGVPTHLGIGMLVRSV